MDALKALQLCRQWFAAMEDRGYTRVLVATQPAGMCLSYLDEAIAKATPRTRAVSRGVEEAESRPCLCRAQVGPLPLVRTGNGEYVQNYPEE